MPSLGQPTPTPAGGSSSSSSSPQPPSSVSFQPGTGIPPGGPTGGFQTPSAGASTNNDDDDSNTWMMGKASIMN